MIFEDPFEAVLRAAAKLGADARVRFVHCSELPRLPGLRFWRRAKGVTWWPDDGSSVEVLIDAQLRRGVQGTLDILAHELAHVIAGPEDDHGPAWAAAYEAIYRLCLERPAVVRRVARGWVNRRKQLPVRSG